MWEHMLLVAVTDAQLRVVTATRERHRIARSGAPWDAVRAARKEESQAVNERDRLLDAVLMHQREWAHDATTCVLCQATSATA
jgi:hypothetical protein